MIRCMLFDTRHVIVGELAYIFLVQHNSEVLL